MAEVVTFGVSAYDRVPHKTGRYHVVDEAGYIRDKTEAGYIAFDHAGNLSDSEADVTFTVVDTRDGSKYGHYRNGEGE